MPHSALILTLKIGCDDGCEKTSYICNDSAKLSISLACPAAQFDYSPKKNVARSPSEIHVIKLRRLYVARVLIAYSILSGGLSDSPNCY
jgi:hypothetical protein